MSLGNQLFEGIAGHTATPHDSTVGIHKKSYRKEFHAIFLDRNDKVATVDILGIRACLFDIEHLGHRGAEDIGIEQSHLITQTGQCHSQIGRDGRLAHAPFSRGDGNDVFHLGQKLSGSGSLRLAALDPYIALDVDIFAHIGEYGCLGSLYHRLLEGIVGLVEDEGKGYLVALDTDIIFDHSCGYQVFAGAGIPHCGQCVKNQFWIYCHNQ